MNDQNANGGNNNGIEKERGERPLRTIRDGSISSSIWERQGQDGPNYSAKVVRNWKDEDGKFHQSNSYSEYDLPRLAEVARNTSDVIAGLRQSRTQTLAQSPEGNAPDKEQSREEYMEQRQTQSRGRQRQNKRVQNDW